MVGVSLEVLKEECYKGADKSLALIDNSYVKIKNISCISSL